MALPSIQVKDGNGANATVFTINSGRQNATDSASFVLSNEDSTALGAINSVAAADETANTGINGILKGIFGKIRSLTGQLPTTLGTTSAANSLSVTLSTENNSVIAKDSSLQSILLAVANTNSVLPTARGQQPSGNSLSVVPAVNTSFSVVGNFWQNTQPISSTSLSNVDSNIGAAADVVASADTGTFSLISLTKRVISKLTLLISAASTSIPDTSSSGSIAMSSTANVLAQTIAGQSTIAVEVTGTWTGTLIAEALIGSTWVGISLTPIGIGLSSVSSITANGVFELIAGGKTQIRLRCSAVGTGTANVLYVLTSGLGIVSVRQGNASNFNATVTPASGTVTATSADNYGRVISGTTLTRLPNATPYTAGQIIGASATIGSASNIMSFANIARTTGGVFRIDRARMFKSQTTTLGSFQLVLFRSSPTLAGADGAAITTSLSVGNSTSTVRVIGRLSFDMTNGLQGIDGVEVGGTPTIGSALEGQCATGSSDIYGILITTPSTGSYTPSSGETISIVLEGYAF
jgi:hypothetical protein